MNRQRNNRTFKEDNSPHTPSQEEKKIISKMAIAVVLNLCKYDTPYKYAKLVATINDYMDTGNITKSGMTATINTYNKYNIAQKCNYKVFAKVNVLSTSSRTDEDEEMLEGLDDLENGVANEEEVEDNVVCSFTGEVVPPESYYLVVDGKVFYRKAIREKLYIKPKM